MSGSSAPATTFRQDHLRVVKPCAVVLAALYVLVVLCSVLAMTTGVFGDTYDISVLGVGFSGSRTDDTVSSEVSLSLAGPVLVLGVLPLVLTFFLRRKG